MHIILLGTGAPLMPDRATTGMIGTAPGCEPLLIARQPLAVHASADTHMGIVAMMAACFPEWEPHTDVRNHEVRGGTTRDIGGFTVEFFEAVHRVPTLAVRVTLGQTTFAFSADTRPTDAIIACAKNADLFLCDAICAEADGEVAAARDLMHPTAREAAEMAVFNREVTLPSDGARFEL